MGLVWQITDDLPNSPNYRPAKLSRYMLHIEFLDDPYYEPLPWLMILTFTWKNHPLTQAMYDC